jgi:hypothetical protein
MYETNESLEKMADDSTPLRITGAPSSGWSDLGLQEDTPTLRLSRPRKGCIPLEGLVLFAASFYLLKQDVVRVANPAKRSAPSIEASQVA